VIFRTNATNPVSEKILPQRKSHPSRGGESLSEKFRIMIGGEVFVGRWAVGAPYALCLEISHMRRRGVEIICEEIL